MGTSMTTRELGGIQPDPSVRWRRILGDALTVASAINEPCVFFVLSTRTGRKMETQEVLVWHEGLADSRPPRRIVRRLHEHLGYSAKTSTVAYPRNHIHGFVCASLSSERARQTTPAFASKSDHREKRMLGIVTYRLGVLSNPLSDCLSLSGCFAEEGRAHALTVASTISFWIEPGMSLDGVTNMTKRQSRIPKGWEEFRLGDLGTLKGGGTPRRAVAKYYTGRIPWITVKDLKEDEFYVTGAIEHITPDAIDDSATNLIDAHSVIIATRVGLGKVAINKVPVAINQDLKAMTPNRKVLPDFLLFLIYKSAFDILRYSVGTTVKGIRQDDLLNIRVILPPPPVQERIVQILHKSDELRRKRQRALETANSILSSSIISMFGDPKDDHAFERIPLGQLADVRSGVTKGRELHGKKTVEVPYLRVANVQDGFLDLSEIKMINVLPEDVDKYHLEDGDILMTEGGDPDKLGRGCVWRNQVEGCIHQNHVFRVRTERDQLAPEYLAGLLRTQYAKEYFLSCAKRSSNLASVNSTQVKAFAVPRPPIKASREVGRAVEQWVEASNRLSGALKDANNLFASLMDAAFSGNLTAPWEKANAESILAQAHLYDHLPQLLLLAVIRNAVRREEPDDGSVMITSLMKYAFLVQMEGGGRRRFYRFVPYHYGPFSKEIYGDLEFLKTEGFVSIENDSEIKKLVSLW